MWWWVLEWDLRSQHGEAIFMGQMVRLGGLKKDKEIGFTETLKTKITHQDM